MKQIGADGRDRGSQPLGAQAADGPHLAGDRARGDDGRRHLRAHRHDRPLVRAHLHRSRTRASTRSSPSKENIDTFDGRGARVPGLGPEAGRGGRRRRRGRGLDRRPAGRRSSAPTASPAAATGRRASASRSAFPTATASTRSPTSRAARRRARRPGRDRQGVGRGRGLRGRRHGHDRRPRGTGDYTLSGIATLGDVDSFGGATITVLTLPEAQRVTGKEGEFDQISVAADEGVSPDGWRRR